MRAAGIMAGRLSRRLISRPTPLTPEPNHDGGCRVASSWCFCWFPAAKISCNRPSPPHPRHRRRRVHQRDRVADRHADCDAHRPLPYAQRNFPCLSNTIVGKEFEYCAGDKQEVHLISAKLGEDSKLIAKANHVSRFSVIEHGRSVHIDNQHIVPCDITNGILVNLPQRMLFYFTGREAGEPRIRSR